jgi:glycosyltransferase involved in cell wall biosynthesis
VPELTSCVVICTRDRPTDLERCIRSVVTERANAEIVVVDASSDDRTLELSLTWTRQGAILHYLRADRPGLARQRNQSIPFCHSLDVDLVHFLDDDSEILPGYFEAIERRFTCDEGVAGVGGVLEDMPVEYHTHLKRLFLLWDPTPGRVLRSGRVVKGQFPDITTAYDVDFLLGCSMTYRLTALIQHRFEDRLEGRSLGEDARFGYQVSRSSRLIVEPLARCLHHESELNRAGEEVLAYERTILTFCWVREQRSNGMSLLLFTWSAVGDTLLRAVHAVVTADAADLGRARGNLKALWRILRGHVTMATAYRPLV